jgi:Do/DeqQ family serine protease
MSIRTPPRTCRHPRLVLNLLVCLLPSTLVALPAQVGGQPLPSLAPMLEGAMPAVINVSTVTQIQAADHPLLRDPFFRRFFDLPESRRREESSLGSGVIVDAERGIALTNHHVVAQADAIRVTLHDGRTLDAELIGADPDTDVAVLRLPRGTSNGAVSLRALPMADSDGLRVGDFVVAIGNPFGLKQTVTSGIVSGLGRSGLGIEGYEDFIQTDASINPGNSGGPLVNLRGELVGINTAILAPGGGNIGIGFAIPINMARPVMEQILAHGRVRRGLFGVAVQALTPDLARALGLTDVAGVLVSAIEPGSPAAEAGLREGDLILTMDGRPVADVGDLRNRFALLPIGTMVNLKVMRSGRLLELTGHIADPYADFVPGEQVYRAFAGALLGESDASQAGADEDGVRVGLVERGGGAWSMGLREGDLVVAVNGRSVTGLRELALALRRSNGLYNLHLRRGGNLVVLSRH